MAYRRTDGFDELESLALQAGWDRGSETPAWAWLQFRVSRMKDLLEECSAILSWDVENLDLVPGDKERRKSLVNDIQYLFSQRAP